PAGGGARGAAPDPVLPGGDARGGGGRGRVRLPGGGHAPLLAGAVARQRNRTAAAPAAGGGGRGGRGGGPRNCVICRRRWPPGWPRTGTTGRRRDRSWRTSR